MPSTSGRMRMRSGSRSRPSWRRTSCAGPAPGGGDERVARPRDGSLPSPALRVRHSLHVPGRGGAWRGRSRRRLRHPLVGPDRHDLPPLHALELDPLLRRGVDPHAGRLPRIERDRQVPGAGADILMLVELLAASTMLLGTFFMVVTGVGLVRFPDVYTRMHAAGKA